jgi:hypothetical protein
VAAGVLGLAGALRFCGQVLLLFCISSGVILHQAASQLHCGRTVVPGMPKDARGDLIISRSHT